jgi:hypothetical protein
MIFFLSHSTLQTKRRDRIRVLEPRTRTLGHNICHPEHSHSSDSLIPVGKYWAPRMFRSTFLTLHLSQPTLFMCGPIKQ